MTNFNTEYKKAQLVCNEVSKYAKSFEQECDLQQQIIALQHSGQEINLQNIDGLNSIEIYDAYLDCKSNYPQEFTTISTPVQEVEEKITSYLLWDKISCGTYHSLIPVGKFEYGLTISKEEGRWVIWGEDHDVTDYDENLDWQGKVVGFKTLWEAKEASEGIREWMQECGEEAWGEDC
jgi:hypothetical protein